MVAIEGECRPAPRRRECAAGKADFVSTSIVDLRKVVSRSHMINAEEKVAEMRKHFRKEIPSQADIRCLVRHGEAE